MQAKKHISPKLVEKAAEVGIELKILDPDKPLKDQEPFSVVLHKIRDAGSSRMRGQGWYDPTGSLPFDRMQAS